MSKIICEICGTAYPETSTQCPICGYVRSAETAGIAVDEISESGSSQYTYVKGGRFSKANVKKRHRAQQKAASSGASAAVVNNPRPHNEKQKKGKKNIGFIIVSIFLLLLVLVVVVFLTIKYFGTDLSSSTPQQDSTTQESEQDDNALACSGIMLDVTEVVLTEIGEAWMINALPSPANTTDIVVFSSSNESVAIVNNDGKIVAVAPGEATITVKCGSFQASCLVKCEIVPETEPTMEQTEPTTEQTEPTTEEPTTEPTIVLDKSMFNTKYFDVTMSFKGEKWTYYSGDIDVSLITWTSDNPNVAIIENGIVKAVGRGTTKVHAEYNGVKISCIVRCNF